MAKEQKNGLTVDPIESLEDSRLSKPGLPKPETDLFGNAPDNPPTTLHCTGGYYFLLPHRQLTPDEVPLVEMARKEIASLTEPIDVPNRSEQKPGTVPVSLTVPSDNFPDRDGVAPDPAADSAGDTKAGAINPKGNRRSNVGDPGGRRDEITAANEKNAESEKDE